VFFAVKNYVNFDKVIAKRRIRVASYSNRKSTAKLFDIFDFMYLLFYFILS